jgi:hypothetical protein
VRDPTTLGGPVNRSRRILLSVLASFSFVAALVAAGPAHATPPGPQLRVFSPTSSINEYRYRAKQKISVDSGFWVSASDSTFEVIAHRDSYTSPIVATQIIDPDTSARQVVLPDTVIAPRWSGLRRFFTVTVTGPTGDTVYSGSVPFCPDSWNVQRLDASGPMNATFPQGCYTNPFTTGVVWGIDQGWAVGALEMSRIRFAGPDGTYSVHVQITPLYQRLFAIAPADASATLGLAVTTSPTGCPPYCAPSRTASSSTADGSTLPTRTNPRPSTLPDLVALPAWGMSIDEYSEPGRDFLDFGATVWDAGPAPMVVEGFRRTGTNIMDGWQTFYRGDKPVARAPVGTLVYDSDPGHEHWHFKQFAAYRLLGADKQQVVRSQKTGFCLAPTDAIDLTVQGAKWNPGALGLGSACGDASAIWIRESLPTGWGDTYFQGLPGQSFDITDLPNGTYFIQVQADPTGEIYERSSANDSRLRKVILGGVPGARTVTVPPWHGIDTG